MPFMSLPLEIRSMAYKNCIIPEPIQFSFDEERPALSLDGDSATLLEISNVTRQEVQGELRREGVLTLDFHGESPSHDPTHVPAFQQRVEMLVSDVLYRYRNYKVTLNLLPGPLTQPTMDLLWEIVEALSWHKTLGSLSIVVCVDFECHAWRFPGDARRCVASALQPFAWGIRNVQNAEIKPWSNRCECPSLLQVEDYTVADMQEVENLMRSNLPMSDTLCKFSSL